MSGLNREFGLAVIGCGAIGRIRADLARDYPGIGWLGVCGIYAEFGHKLQQDMGAILAAVEQGHAPFLKKPRTATVIW